MVGLDSILESYTLRMEELRLLKILIRTPVSLNHLVAREYIMDW